MLFIALPRTQAVSPLTPVPVERLPIDAKIETVVGSANQLVAMDFTPDGRLLYTERTGNVRIVSGTLLGTPVIHFNVDTQGERGLLGIAVDPNFNANHYVWVYLTTPQGSGGSCGSIENQIIRFKLIGNAGGNPQIAKCYPVDRYQTIHNGGNLHFGPDGKLVVTVGNNTGVNDSDDPSQNLTLPLGKLHRYTPGVPLSVPSDNPFYASGVPGIDKSIYAYGLRNSFDFTFDPITQKIFATENGDGCDDELNRILAGGNYGWRPYYPCDDKASTGPSPTYNTIPPLIYWTPTLAPTGLAFYTGAAIPEWQNDLFMCNFKDATTALHHFKLNAGRTAITAHTVISGVKCRTDVLTGPDGALYYAENGGWSSGSIKRIARYSSFAGTSVGAQPINPPSGSQVDYTIYLRHTGSSTNTFALIVDAPPTQLWIIDAQAHSGTLTYTSFSLRWSGVITGTQTWSATYRTQLAYNPATYPVTTALRLTAHGLPPLALTPTVIVNGLLVYLPIVTRN
jgi:glucose/arabinose dehydrogenase